MNYLSSFSLVWIGMLLIVACQGEKDFSLPYEKFVLDNGLQVVLHEDKSDPIVSVAIQYHVGSAREKPGKTGFAHLFEHMLFQRSEHLGRNEFFKKIGELGGSFNGATGPDGTVYYETVPRDALEKVLWMESDRMGFFINTVTRKGLEREIDVVSNEKRQNENRPFGQSNGMMLKQFYPEGHPYRWPVIGSIADLHGATVDDIKQFYRKYYAPNNATLVVARNVQGLIKKLLAGEGDIIAYNVPITKELKDSLIYCGEEVITHQVIVQRAGGKTKPLTDVTELIGKDVYVKPGKYYDRLVNLDKELGGGIHIHKVTNDSISVEDLITQVSQGKIPYTVADNDVARLNTTYYPNLNIKLSISFDQRASWAVRKDSPELAAAANKWHEENMTSPAYTASMKRYFEISKATPHTSILSLREGKISHFDELFKKYASEIDWDWRLLASLAYTESNFDTTAVSWAGAKGLMQLMPATARAMGMPEGKEQNPEESVKAAIKYINATSKSFSSVPKEERLNFVLASYNSGIGHVQDAMALAEKYGKNKYVWKDNVENFILLKSNEEYFTDPVCKNGYFRGIETYNFVRDIMGRYETYKKKIKK